MRALPSLMILAALLTPISRAQGPVPVFAAPPAAPLSAPVRSADQMEQLVAPIALYPDVVLAIVLPAATAPTDLVLAARHVRERPGDSWFLESQPWDESVKSLTSYPEVLFWMDENLDWTRQLGESFATQPAAVMQATQRLRARARATGVLADSQQHSVILEADVIRIVPARPDVIYVPSYQPDILLLPPTNWSARPYLAFSVGVPVGSWLAFECDWRRHTVWVGNRQRPWNGHDWRRPLVAAPVTVVTTAARPPEVRAWRPTPRSAPPARPAVVEVIRPRPLAVDAGRTLRPTNAAGPGPRDPGPATTIVRSPVSPNPAPPNRGTPPAQRPAPPNAPVVSTSPRVTAPATGAAPPYPATTSVPPSNTPGRTTEPTPRPRTTRPERPEVRTQVTPGPSETHPATRPSAAPPASIPSGRNAPAATSATSSPARPTPPYQATTKAAPADPAPATTNATTTPPARGEGGRNRERRELNQP